MVEYIEKTDAINSLLRYSGKHYGWAKAVIETVPVADVAPVRHGKWLFDDFDGDGYDYQCSVCEMYQRKSSNYCPHCGAKMDL